MSKIIFIKPFNASFILSDQQILEKHFQVKTYLLGSDKGRFAYPLIMLKLFFYLLINVPKSDVVITWFADYHSLFMVCIARLFGKRSVIFAGGMEAVNYPEIKKGVYRKKFRGTCTKLALLHTSLIIPNHKSLVYHENYYYDPNGKKDGMKYYVPNLKTKIEVIHNGYDVEKFKRDYTFNKNPRLVLSFGRTVTIYDILNKGYDLFIEVARRNPQLEFVIMAIAKEHLGWIEEHFSVSEIPNLKIIPYRCSFEILSRNFNEAKVFVQASITEGMPNTLGEAMLFDCIPVGSNVNGIPDSIGDTGVIVYKRSVEELEQAILKALTMDTAAQAREYIIRNFTMDHREKEIVRVLNEIDIS